MKKVLRLNTLGKYMSSPSCWPDSAPCQVVGPSRAKSKLRLGLASTSKAHDVHGLGALLCPTVFVVGFAWGYYILAQHT